MRLRATFMALAGLGAALMAPSLTFSATAQDSPDSAPDPVAALALELKAGGKPLVFTSPVQGYTPDLLKRLKLAGDSQVLVFSRTSLQQGFIDPATPRAIYFNDTISLGYIPGAPLIEMWAVGRDGTMRFYTLKNVRSGAPQLEPQTDECTVCHATTNPTEPSPMIISASTLPNGNVLHQDRLTDGRTPINQRWGGWYVTGRHGDMRHLGNVVTEAVNAPKTDKGLNVTSLAGRFDASRYERATSDIVALMTLEHESGFLNVVGAVQAQAVANTDPAALDKAIDELADYMLGVDAAVLTAQVRGVSGFAERFAAEGPKDGKGRSLKDFDLRTRLFRYPLSYMIYTPAFDALPEAARTRVYRRLADVLSGRDTSAKYASLSAADRAAALEILAQTKPGLPAFWRSGP